MADALKITLVEPVMNGERRPLTPLESREVRAQRTRVQPYPGRRWTIGRTNGGRLDLRCEMPGFGASWVIKERSQRCERQA